MFTATKSQAATYLLGVCLFSISFLVFLNSSVSFVVTEIIGEKSGIGNAVGTLGFADELVALIACPLWGVLSDRIGVRAVSTIGYAIVGLSLFLFVQAQNIFPQLLLARMFFSVGGAATATMVTAILPSMTASGLLGGEGVHNTDSVDDETGEPSSPSVSSEFGNRPTRVQDHAEKPPTHASPTRLAGLVGVFTGCGALVALAVFLPLPTQFKKQHMSASQALKDTFYVVGSVALLVAGVCFLGLRQLKGEQEKGWHSIWISDKHEGIRPRRRPTLPYWGLVLESIKAGFYDYRIGLGYLGGFVARASSVGISLFIPLAVNTYFLSSGRCKVDGDDPKAVKTQCHEAYVLASILTGVSQLVALIFAPIFGFLADKYRLFEIPLLISTITGIIGYFWFASLESPEFHGEQGSLVVFFVVALLGISQIGAIVCSLGLLGRGIAGLEEDVYVSNMRETDRSSGATDNAGRSVDGAEDRDGSESGEDSHLLSSAKAHRGHRSLNHVQGSIAGTYSLLGGAGILLLTKLGGFLFDRTSTAAPFVILAIFNMLLFAATSINGIFTLLRIRQKNTR